MKEVILSADGDSILYLVPDDVAENLEEYCLKSTRITPALISKR